jgi:hypothetical protein
MYQRVGTIKLNRYLQGCNSFEKYESFRLQDFGHLSSITSIKSRMVTKTI